MPTIALRAQAKMEAVISSGVLSSLLEDMFWYGCLWVYVESTEEVRNIKLRNGQNTGEISRAIIKEYEALIRIHLRVQECVRRWHLVLGHSPSSPCIVIIDDELD